MCRLVPGMGGGKNLGDETGCCIRIMPEKENDSSGWLTESMFDGQRDDAVFGKLAYTGCEFQIRIRKVLRIMGGKGESVLQSNISREVHSAEILHFTGTIKKVYLSKCTVILHKENIHMLPFSFH